MSPPQHACDVMDILHPNDFRRAIIYVIAKALRGMQGPQRNGKELATCNTSCMCFSSRRDKEDWSSLHERPPSYLKSVLTRKTKGWS